MLCGVTVDALVPCPLLSRVPCVLQLSCYVKWGCGNTSNLALLSGVKAAFPGKAVVIGE